MATLSKIVDKEDLMKILETMGDHDVVGMLAAVQDGIDAPCHEVLILYHPFHSII